MSAGAVMVTGAAGLVGNAVRVMLEQAGRDVIPVDRVAATEEGRPIVQCDVTEVHRLHAVVLGRQLSGVIHCGAFSGPMVARDNPPAMVGIETLAMVESSTCMKVPSASAMAVMARRPPVRGVGPALTGPALTGEDMKRLLYQNRKKTPH